MRPEGSAVFYDPGVMSLGARKSQPSVLDGKRGGELSAVELEAPRIPRAPSTPDLVPGRDFHPLQGEPLSLRVEPRRREERSASLEGPGRGTIVRGREALPALLATGIGFGLGVAVAWAIGVI